MLTSTDIFLLDNLIHYFLEGSGRKREAFLFWLQDNPEALNGLYSRMFPLWEGIRITNDMSEEQLLADLEVLLGISMMADVISDAYSPTHPLVESLYHFVMQVSEFDLGRSPRPEVLISWAENHQKSLEGISVDSITAMFLDICANPVEEAELAKLNDLADQIAKSILGDDYNAGDT